MGILLFVFLLVWAIGFFGGWVTRTNYPWIGNLFYGILFLMIILYMFGVFHS